MTVKQKSSTDLDDLLGLIAKSWAHQAGCGPARRSHRSGIMLDIAALPSTLSANSHHSAVLEHKER